MESSIARHTLSVIINRTIRSGCCWTSQTSTLVFDAIFTVKIISNVTRYTINITMINAGSTIRSKTIGRTSTVYEMISVDTRNTIWLAMIITISAITCNTIRTYTLVFDAIITVKMISNVTGYTIYIAMINAGSTIWSESIGRTSTVYEMISVDTRSTI